MFYRYLLFFQGSRTETSGDPEHVLDSTTLSNKETTSDSVMLDHLEGTSTKGIIRTEPTGENMKYSKRFTVGIVFFW